MIATFGDRHACDKCRNPPRGKPSNASNETRLTLTSLYSFVLSALISADPNRRLSQSLRSIRQALTCQNCQVITLGLATQAVTVGRRIGSLREPPIRARP